MNNKLKLIVSSAVIIGVMSFTGCTFSKLANMQKDTNKTEQSSQVKSEDSESESPVKEKGHKSPVKTKKTQSLVTERPKGNTDSATKLNNFSLSHAEYDSARYQITNYRSVLDEMLASTDPGDMDQVQLNLNALTELHMDLKELYISKDRPQLINTKGCASVYMRTVKDMFQTIRNNGDEEDMKRASDNMVKASAEFDEALSNLEFSNED